MMYYPTVQATARGIGGLPATRGQTITRQSPASSVFLKVQIYETKPENFKPTKSTTD